MSSSIMTIRFDEDEKALITSYASAFNQNVSEFVRETVFRRIEDELDLKIWDEALEEHRKDPATFSADEIEAKYL